jgi:corrinoid protein of di/trimethylamine methyltransferase
MMDLSLLYDAILKGKSKNAVEATNLALADGAEPKMLIDEYMIRAMGEVGRRFENQEIFVPELLMAGRAMKASLNILQPIMKSNGEKTSIGKIIIGTVKGDLHDIGKNLVASMLEGCGFEVIDIGIDMDSDKFVESVREHDADVLGLSALLTTTMPYMKTVIDALIDAGLRDKVKIIVGGAPVSAGFAAEIGADGYGDTANSAVTTVKDLLGIK